MDITCLETQLKYTSASTGYALNIEERYSCAQKRLCHARHHLKLNLMKLKETQGADEIFFWGKIRGTLELTAKTLIGIVKDYYIAIGVNYKGHKDFPQKLFYWATTNYVFAPLPAARAEFEEVAKKMEGYFTGEHEKVLQAVPKKPSVPVDPESAEVELVLDSKDFTELDRLAYVVRRVEKDTHVVPQGAFKLTPIQEIRKNETFKGLGKEELDKLGMYQHFRPAETTEKIELLERNEGVLQTDVFDSLAQDKPKGAWTIQVQSGHVAAVRSLLWPGYSFYHAGMTGDYWGVYIGDGVMNKDLPFML